MPPYSNRPSGGNAAVSFLTTDKSWSESLASLKVLKSHQTEAPSVDFFEKCVVPQYKYTCCDAITLSNIFEVC